VRAGDRGRGRVDALHVKKKIKKIKIKIIIIIIKQY
jgi:hypothetical protein